MNAAKASHEDAHDSKVNPSIAAVTPNSAVETASAQRGISQPAPVLKVCNLRKVFGAKNRKAIAAGEGHVAVDNVSFSVFPGECVGLVGESGSGKSTVANMVLRLEDVTDGQVLLNGTDITHAHGKQLREAYRAMQVVFQNPTGSFDPRQTLGASATEGLRNAGVSKDEAKQRVTELFEKCGLLAALMTRYPREASGGQCQRAAIARALAMEPDLLICDEATSALDVTVQRQVIELLANLRAELNMSMLFICQDIALVSAICDRILVMKDGRIVEEGFTASVLSNPQSAYTKTLIDSVL